MSAIQGWICMLLNILLVNMQSITVRGEPCQAKTLFASELHYFAEQCTKELHAHIARNFIELVTQHLDIIRGDNEKEKSAIENVRVECGERSITLRRRDIVDSEQSSKVPLTLKFATKVPLPCNVSVVDLNQTAQQMTSDILASLNKIGLTLNITGVVLEYDASKPPVVHIIGLVCDKGQALKGTKCVSCSPGYFLDIAGCQACAVDQYQDQEAQSSCVPCPPGTSTLGQVASKWPEDCRDNTPPSFNNTCPGNQVFYTGKCSSRRTLRRWKEPVATDNSGHVSISYPAIRPPVNLSIGLYNVLYSAIDSSGNGANCTFIVQVARKSCPVLQQPISGSIASLSCGFSFGSQATLTCDAGYQMAGSSLRSCGADGTWSGKVTTCNIVKCPSIKAPSHGMVFPSTCQIPSGVNYKTECFFACNVTVGYQLEGAPKVVCLENGSWSADTTKTICRDFEPPRIEDCPVHIYKTSKDKWTKIFFPEVRVTDNVGVHLFTTSRKNGSNFTWGEHNVTYTASDMAGNTAECHFQVVIGANRCPDLPTPLNGAKTCDSSPDEMSCILHCYAGYDFANNQPQSYVCNPIKGTWVPSSKVLDCSGTHHAKVLLAFELHYLADKCTGGKGDGTAINFITLYTQYLGTLGGCFGNVSYIIENVNVKCGERDIMLGRKLVVYDDQPSKVPLIVNSTVKVALPSNASFVDVNQTIQRLSSNVRKCLMETDLTLNFSGAVLEYDASKPPVLRVGSLVCDKGQVLKGTTCVNCPRGYFFNTTRCRACAVDKYQDQEAQTSCVPCPRGKSTLGKVASTHCLDRRESARHNQIPMISGTIAGTLTLITIIIVVFVRHRYIRNKRMTSNPGTTLAYSTGETAIQIEREADQDSPCCSNETPHTSIPKYVTKSEAVFTSAGGELNAPFDSNVRIIIPKGAIPAGANQPVSFGVFLDEIPLLRDIPEEPNTTLISPVVECGPHDIKLSNPVEIVVPHCLCLSKAKKKWIKVYRCGNFVAGCEGLLSWERVPNKSEKKGQSKSWFTVGKDSIRIKTKTFSLWSIFACGGPRRKRATVFASRPDPKSDLIYIRFYVYSDNEDSKRRVEVKDRERFPDSKPAREQPFRMYKDNKDITVKLTDLEEGWEFDKTNDTQIYHYDKASGNGFRSKNACDFAVKPEDGRDVNGFSCMVKFEQEDDQQEYSIYLNPGFTPLKRQSIRVKPAAGDQSLTASSNTSAIAGCSTSKGTEEEGCHSHNQEGESSPDSSRDKGCAQCDHFQFTSLGLCNGKPVTENLLYGISPYVGVMWKPLLRKLSIKEAIIRNLEEDYRNASVDEKCYQGLLAWKNGQGPQGATIKTLWDALVVVPGCSEAINALRSEIAPRISHC